MGWILNKFYKTLEAIAKIEKVPIIYHKNMVALNEALYTHEELEMTPPGHWAVACYRHSIGKANGEIHMSRKDVWSLAHELGHHFGIKCNNDPSEEMAEIATSMLANRFIPGWQRMFIGIEISVYAPKTLIKKKGNIWEEITSDLSESLKESGKEKILNL